MSAFLWNAFREPAGSRPQRRDFSPRLTRRNRGWVPKTTRVPCGRHDELSGQLSRWIAVHMVRKPVQCMGIK